MPNDLLTTRDVARLARLDPAHIVRSIKSGNLAATRIGRDWLIERAEAERFASSERKSGPKPKKETA